MIVHNGNILKINGNWLIAHEEPVPPEPDPYNPLNLPPYTIRIKIRTGYTPHPTHGTATQVSSDPNIWDLTYESSDWSEIFDSTDSYLELDLLEVLGANSTGVTDMHSMFDYCINMTSVSIFDTRGVTNMRLMFSRCYNLQSIPLYDTSSVTNMRSMFSKCCSLETIPLLNTSNVTDMYGMFGSTPVQGYTYHLTTIPLIDTSKVTNMGYMFSESSIQTIPLFDTSSVTNMDYAFYYCRKVESGALALYQQASSQTTPPSSHTSTFESCGSDTTTGAAELDQIPESWGGNQW